MTPQPRRTILHEEPRVLLPGLERAGGPASGNGRNCIHFPLRGVPCRRSTRRSDAGRTRDERRGDRLRLQFR